MTDTIKPAELPRLPEIATPAAPAPPDDVLCCAGPGPDYSYREFSTGFQVSKDRPAFDSSLRDAYAKTIRELVERQTRAMNMFLGATWEPEPYTPPSLARRLRYRLSDLWFRVRHALCCGACQDEY